MGRRLYPRLRVAHMVLQDQISTRRRVSSSTLVHSNQIARTLISNLNKLVYTDFSRQNRLRLEDSFLPGALQSFYIVTFRGAS
jgi:hypothetical protein